jgi:DNA-binding CsgD family transcriptional regulator
MVRVRAERGPLLLAVDDAQFCDDASLRVLDFLSHRLDDLPVLLLIAGGPATGALAAVADDRELTQVVLGPLEPDDAAELVRERLGHDTAPEAMAAAVAAAGGNPFLLGELAAGLAADPTANPAELALPEVDRFVAHQLADLDAEARALASVLAVLDDGPADAAAALAGLTSEQADRAAAALRADGLGDGAPVRLAAPLARAAVLRLTAPAELQRLHADAARLLDRLGAGPDAVARHLIAAPLGLDDRSLTTLRTAATRAANAGDAATAVALLDRLDREPLDRDLRRAVRVEAAAAAVRAAGSAGLARFADALLLAEDERAHVEVLLAQAMALIELGRLDAVRRELDDIRATIERALDGDPELLLRVDALRPLLAAVPGAPTEVADATRRMLDDDPPALLPQARELLCTEAFAAVVRGDGPRAARTVARALDDVAALRAVAPTAVLVAVVAAVRTDQVALAERAATEMLAEAERTGERSRLGIAHTQAALPALAAGRLADSALHGRAALEALDAEDAMHGAVAAGHLAEALIELGRLDEAERVLAEYRRPPDVHPRVVLQIDLAAALIALERGRPEAALTLIEAAATVVSPASTVPIGPILARTLLRLGRADEARAVVTRELALTRERACGPSSVGIALRAAGAVDSDLALLEQAVGELRRSPARVDLARALLELGMALRRGRRRADARPILREAIAVAQECGAAPLAEAAAHELQATGARVRRGGVLEREALTPRQRRIALMAADGATNAEIAQALFITRGTVEMHLGRAYAKLGIGSRRELAGALSSKDPDASVA